MANDPFSVTSIARVQSVPDALQRDDAEQQRRRRNALRNARRPAPAAGSDTSDTSQPSQESVVPGNHGKLHVTA